MDTNDNWLVEANNFKVAADKALKTAKEKGRAYTSGTQLQTLTLIGETK